jgi:hypothetical protein
MSEHELRTAYERMVRIVRERDDGRAFVPIVMRLKQALDAHQSADAVSDMIVKGEARL